MNVDGVLQTVIRFVSNTPVPEEPTNPDFYGTQTGDPLSWILFGILAAIIVASGVALYVYRKRALASGFGGMHSKKFNPLKDTKFMFVSAIVLLVIVALGMFCFKYANNAYAAQQYSEGVNSSTPAEILADVTDDGIVFEKKFDQNVSYITNDNANDVTVCYLSIDSSALTTDDNVTWTITVGQGDYKTEFVLEAGQTMMSKFVIDKYHTLPVNISTDMSVDKAKELINQNVLTMTFGVLDTYVADSYQIENLYDACTRAAKKGPQSIDEIRNVFNDNDEGEFLYSLLAATYDGWTKATNAGLGFYTIAELMSPECFPGGTKNSAIANKMNAIATFNSAHNAPDNMLEEEWNAYYEAIARTHIFKKLISEYSGMVGDEGALNNYFAQENILCSLCYYDLVRLFGPVPIVEFRQDPTISRSSVEEVNDYIIKMTEQYLDGLGWRQSRDADQYGKIDKAVAYTLIGFVSRDRKDYSRAKESFMQVINSGYTSLANEYRFNFAMPSLEFEKDSSGYSTVRHFDSADQLIDALYNESGYENRHRETILSQNFVDSTKAAQNGRRAKEWQKPKAWQDNLGMLNTTYGSVPSGIGLLNVNESYFKYILPDDPQDSAWTPFYNPTDEIKSDKRFVEWNVLYMKGDGTQEHDKYHQTINLENPSIVSNWHCYTGYIPLKYMPISINNNTGNPVYYPTYTPFRFETVLLAAMECYMLTGDEARATGFLNQCRERAGAFAVGRVEQNRIIAYYLKSLAFEAQDFWNVKRLGNLGEIKATTQNLIFPEEFKVDASQVNLTNGWLQIPQSAIESYGYSQNPGW